MTKPKKVKQKDQFDVLTSTMGGGVLWKRYSDGLIVTTYGDEQPQDKVAQAEADRTAARSKRQS